MTAKDLLDPALQWLSDNQSSFYKESKPMECSETLNAPENIKRVEKMDTLEAMDSEGEDGFDSGVQDTGSVLDSVYNILNAVIHKRIVSEEFGEEKEEDESKDHNSCVHYLWDPICNIWQLLFSRFPNSLQSSFSGISFFAPDFVTCSIGSLGTSSLFFL